MSTIKEHFSAYYSNRALNKSKDLQIRYCLPLLPAHLFIVHCAAVTETFLPESG